MSETVLVLAGMRYLLIDGKNRDSKTFMYHSFTVQIVLSVIHVQLR